MDDRPSPNLPKVALGSSERAPFIYFDGAVGCGANSETIKIELGANTIVRDGGGDVIITAHLRCSRTAAIGLRNAIDQALAIKASS